MTATHLDQLPAAGPGRMPLRVCMVPVGSVYGEPATLDTVTTAANRDSQVALLARAWEIRSSASTTVNLFRGDGTSYSTRW